MPDTAASQAIARPGMTCRYTVLTLRVGEARSLTNRLARLIPAATERSDDAFIRDGIRGGPVPGPTGRGPRPAGRAALRCAGPAGTRIAADALLAGRQARELPARARRCAGGLRPLGLRRRAEDASPAGGLPRARPRGGKALGRGRGAARAAAHRGLARHRGLPVVAGLARDPRPARGRPLLLRPREARGRGRAAAHADRGVRDRPAVLAARTLRQLHPRPGHLRGRSRDRRGAAADDGRRRAHQPRRRRIHRAGRDEPRHRLLVVAGRKAPRLCARRRIAGRRGRALRDRRDGRARPQAALSRDRACECAGDARDPARSTPAKSPGATSAARTTTSRASNGIRRAIACSSSGRRATRSGSTCSPIR